MEKIINCNYPQTKNFWSVKNKEENILIEVKGKVIDRKLLDSHYDDRNEDTP